MSLLFIHAIDAATYSRDEGAEYDSPETALALAVRSAVAILAEDVHEGARSAAMEVSVRQANGTEVLRSVVAISVSTMLPAATLGAIGPGQ